MPLNNDYPIDLVLNETHQLIQQLKTQLTTDTNRLVQIEAMIAPNTYNDSNDYAVPAWFGE